MRSFFAFTKKEMTYQLRSFKIMIFALVFAALGFMNPIVAKLTPILIELLSDVMSQSGMSLTVSPVTALDSWMQFYKNVPMGLIVFIVLESNIFTKEYRTGTLIMSLTKGFDRYKAVISKALTAIVMWTASYWLCFVITYVCNAALWDNSVALNLMPSALCWYLFGIWTVALMTLFSTLTHSYIGVLLGVGGAVAVSYTVGLLPKINKYFPTYLANGNSLIYGLAKPEDYTAAIIITVILIAVCFAVSIPVFNKKQL